MAGEETTNQSNIKIEYNQGTTGMNMDNTVTQIQKGVLTYALNAAVENFDANSVNYQNEPGNEFCFSFPEGYVLIGEHAIIEQNKHIFFITNPTTGESEIGYMENNDCIYHTYINADCLNFNIHYPIHKAVHKITNCTTEIYWTDGINPRRYLDLVNPPYTVAPGTDVCANETIPVIDCNKLKMQPNFNIPELSVVDVRSGGDLTAGTYQFAIQYCDSIGDGYTSFYSVTNPTPIADTHITTPNFNYQVGRSIVLDISNIDITGYFKYFNVAVIKTINNITSVELVGTYFIDKSNKEIIYTGQNVTSIKLTVNEIFEKFPYYEIAQDLTAVQDILVWNNLSSIDRINYQSIANQISLQWQSYKLSENEDYSDELNATNLRGYLRDEVYAFEIVFLLKNGKQTDGFHIPGRVKGGNELSHPDVPTTNNDFIGEPDRIDPVTGIGYSPYWKIYNTASVLGRGTGPNIGNATPYQYGDFAYWESTELYPCNEDVWGDLANTPIRHHKFPDILVSPAFESKIFTGQSSMVMGSNSVFPIGVKISESQVYSLIQTSTVLTQDQKDEIVGFKIVRGDRSTNKSIIGKGILRNVGNYEREGTPYYFPNYPYNDLREDPFLLNKSNGYTANGTNAGNTLCRSFTIHLAAGTAAVVEYLDCYTGTIATKKLDNTSGTQRLPVDICSLDYPKPKTYNDGSKPYNAFITCNTYKRYAITIRFGQVTIIQPYPNNSSSIKHTDINNLPAYPLTPSWWNSPYNNMNFADYCLTAFPNDKVCKACLGADDHDIHAPTNYQLSISQPQAIVLGQNTNNQYYYDAVTDPYCNNSYGSCDYFETKEIASFGYDICIPTNLKAFEDLNNKYRLIFNSPETSFGQPFLGKILKLENVIYGAGQAHFTQVKNNAYYKLLTYEAQSDAYDSSKNIAGGTGAPGLFAAYQAYLTIYINGITRRNYSWSFNSILKYNYSSDIYNNASDVWNSNTLGVKQRELELSQYLIPGVQSVGDDKNINNWNRESSVFLKTKTTKTSLPFPNNTPTLISTNSSGVSSPIIYDDTRFILSDARGDCNNPGNNVYESSVVYYGSLKNEFVNQWGQIYSYDTIDTGFQKILDPLKLTDYTVFGGDTFISRFAFKTKLPFFIDNRVGAPDDSDIFYDEIGNVAYPKYWHSARSVLSNKDGLINFISFKAHELDCKNSQASSLGNGQQNPGRTYYDGKMYQFAYGIPYFYCETSINTDLRQAFNNKEGDFWPHVSTGIPDDWLQESFVTIAQDNTYYYNVSYSKQNKENYFNHLPVDWKAQLCYTNYPFRAIYSDAQLSYSDNKINSWLIYRPISFFDFPQNYGKVISLDGIQNRAILTRFENKSLLYNTLLTVDTSNPQAAYLGNSTLFRSAPPVDFAETDLGYVGSQNKMLLKIPQGQISVDAKRGQVFLLSNNQAVDLSAFGSGLNRFFTDHLAFEILRYFPDREVVINNERIVIPGVDVDNHFNGVGLHGVYDSKYDRVIISKLDYIPLPNKGIKYDSATREFYIEEHIAGDIIKVTVYLTDPEYFCNKSWTLSFNVNTKTWISFHSYIPNFYIAENNFFYSGLNGCCDDLQAIAINEIPYVPTTSSSTTHTPITTTSSTTLCKTCKPPISPCSIEAVAQETDCVLDGVVYNLSPTTTTTTMCQRPTGLTNYQLVSGYSYNNIDTIITDNFAEACNGLIFFNGLISTTSILPTLLSVNAGSLTIDQTVYLNAGSTDCTVVSDGWYLNYITDSIGVITDLNIYHIEGGVIAEIVYCVCDEATTTTTTTAQCVEIATCCGISFQSGDTIKYLNYSDPSSFGTLSVPSFTAGFGIAMTSDKLWSINTQITEWNITTAPFTAVFNRNIPFAGGFTTTSGIVAIDDTTLIGADTSVSPNEIVEIDISGGTATTTTKIVLQADREVIGNPLYTTSGKLLILNKETISTSIWFSQYDYATGSLELEIEISLQISKPRAIFECNCQLYIVRNVGDISIIDLEYPYTIIPVYSLNYSVESATQIGSCVNTSFITTTTTTTLA